MFVITFYLLWRLSSRIHLDIFFFTALNRQASAPPLHVRNDSQTRRSLDRALSVPIGASTRSLSLRAFTPTPSHSSGGHRLEGSGSPGLPSGLEAAAKRIDRLSCRMASFEAHLNEAVDSILRMLGDRPRCVLGASFPAQVLPPPLPPPPPPPLSLPPLTASVTAKAERRAKLLRTKHDLEVALEEFSFETRTQL